MKTTRSRMLLVLSIAAFIASLFMHWDEYSRGFIDGYTDGAGISSHN